jgi:hypothetical protein
MPAKSHRFFAINAAIYEATRATMDTAAGYPNGNAETSIPPFASATIATDGRALAAIRGAAIPDAVDAEIQNLLAAGYAAELTRAAYFSLLPPPSDE